MRVDKRLLAFAAAGIMACSALTGCEVLRDAQTRVKSDEERAVGALSSSMTCRDQSGRRIYDGVWLGDGAPASNGDPLPTAFQSRDALRLRTADEIAFTQVMAELSSALGWRVHLAADDVRGAANAAAPGLPGMPATGAAGVAGRMRLDHAGSVPEVLDAIARRFNVAWEADAAARTIRFTRTQTRVFQLAGLPADVVVRNAIDPTGSGSQSGAAGGNTQVTANPQPGRQQVTTSIDQSKVWSQVEDGVKTLLGPSGDVSLSPATGLMVVRAGPDRMREVAAYIRLQNETRLRAVTVKVVVLNIRIADSDEYSLRLRPAFAERGLSLTSSSPATVATTTGIGQLTAGIVSNPTGEDLRRFANSQAIVQALSTLGRVSVRNEATIFTLNDQPTPLLVGSQTSYLASVSQSAVSSAGVQTSLVPGIVTSGTSLNVLPRIRGDGRLVLNYALSISELRRLNNVSSGGQTIQVPEVDTRAVQQAVEIGSCETLLITGFQQDQSRLSREGVGWPDFLGLGGAATGTRTSDMLAILITPEVRTLYRGNPAEASR